MLSIEDRDADAGSSTGTRREGIKRVPIDGGEEERFGPDGRELEPRADGLAVLLRGGTNLVLVEYATGMSARGATCQTPRVSPSHPIAAGSLMSTRYPRTPKSYICRAGGNVTAVSTSERSGRSCRSRRESRPSR